MFALCADFRNARGEKLRFSCSPPFGTYRRSTGGETVSEERSGYIETSAAVLGLVIPPACRPGVESNLELFLHHAAIVASADDDPLREPAEALRP